MSAFWIDRNEVTNAEYKRFVDAGGYRRREFWQEPFVDGRQGRRMGARDGALRRLDGATGPGPLDPGGTPAGDDHLPVTGVSWYEAAAYARFAGKQLPTIHHWARAAEPRPRGGWCRSAISASRGAGAAGARPALHISGALDMAGNVKEWTSTDSGDGRRYILGGAWDEPIYTFNDPDARAPFDRGRTFGFRCVTYPTAPAATLLAPLPWLTRDYTREQPASDAVFEIYRRLYAYDRQPFTAKTLATADDRRRRSSRNGPHPGSLRRRRR